MQAPTVKMLAAAAFVGLAALVASAADESADSAVQKQKAAALANWKQLFGADAPPPTPAETPHFLVYGTVPDKTLETTGAALEREVPLAVKALQLDPKEQFWVGKLTVYLFGERADFNSFVRQVAEKRADPDLLGTFTIRGDTPYVAAGPGVSRQDPPTEVQAGEQLAQALLTRKGGSTIPDWVASGFGRATVWRSAPASEYARQQRLQARQLVLKGRTGMDVWNGNLDAAEATVLRASLIDYLAYGPMGKSFPKFLEAIKPDEEGPNKKKNAGNALKEMGYSGERVSAAWRAWVLRGGT